VRDLLFVRDWDAATSGVRTGRGGARRPVD